MSAIARKRRCRNFPVASSNVLQSPVRWSTSRRSSSPTSQTAPLDSERALTVVRILNEMAQRFGTAIIVVTHDEKIIPTFRRIYHIRDGRTYEQAGEARAA